MCKPTSATMHGGTCLLYISYAVQYKSSGYDDTTKKAGVDIKPMSDITLTFLRITKPEKLLSYLENHGFSLSQKFAGVYYVSGVAELKIQIVVGAELEGDEFVPLRVQKEKAAEDDIRKFIEMCGELREQADKDMADTIIQISISNNKKTYNLADVAVLPSMWDEPAGLTNIEAMACGIPMITTDAGGIPEYAVGETLFHRDGELVSEISYDIEIRMRGEKADIQDRKDRAERYIERIENRTYIDRLVKSLEG